MGVGFVVVVVVRRSRRSRRRVPFGSRPIRVSERIQPAPALRPIRRAEVGRRWRIVESEYPGGSPCAGGLI